MCCLTYENETYQKLKKELPKIGKTVMTNSGKAKVIRHNPLSNRLTVRLDGGLEMEIGIDQINKTEDKNKK
jgi:cell fate regulator YaaT (PSP1 superfamily)